MDDKRFEIKLVDINRLQPAPYNPRVELNENDAEYQHIKNSILNFGYSEPIVWNEVTGYIVSGHQRAKVLKDLGREQVEVIVVHIESDAKEKAMNMAMNKAVGLWDNNKVEALLSELRDTDFEMADFGFASETIDWGDTDLDNFEEASGTRDPMVECPCCGEKFLKSKLIKVTEGFEV